MGSWSEWLDLSPLVEVAAGHVDRPTRDTLEEASKLLADGKARSADRVLARASDSSGRHWISVARADLAALNFTVCIRGVAWRLPDDREEALERRIDFDPETRIEAGDISVEAMLSNLDAALASGADDSPLTTQARIARARVTAFVANCSPNDDVASRANGILSSDLATLAAQAHLTPDLAYLWAGIQMSTYSGAAARPFLLQAKEGGFSDPSVTYMLAIIALDGREIEQADQLAKEAAEAYGTLGDRLQQAQCVFLRGEAALQGEKPELARGHFEAALEIVPDHVAAIVGLTRLELEADGASEAAQALNDLLPRLMGAGELEAAQATEAAEAAEAAAVAANLEALVVMTNEDILLAEVCREALLTNIDAESDAMRRGLRYFFAATLDVRLGDYQAAQGHAGTAELEFEETGLPAPVNPREFLDRLAGGI
jgi:tetratricopeptide (TPR) repeat protein